MRYKENLVIGSQECRELANAIVLQAVEDWRALLCGGQPSQASFAEIREFLLGDWADFLCRKISARAILCQMEKESREAGVYRPDELVETYYEN